MQLRLPQFTLESGVRFMRRRPSSATCGSKTSQSHSLETITRKRGVSIALSAMVSERRRATT